MRMKKFILLVIILISLCSCSHSPMITYCIGMEYNFGSIYDDKENERFIMTYINNSTYKSTFSFRFASSDYEYVYKFDGSNDDFLITSDDDIPLELDESGYYTFNSTKTFYAYYNKLETNIKDKINSGNYNIIFISNYFSVISSEIITTSL